MPEEKKGRGSNNTAAFEISNGRYESQSLSLTGSTTSECDSGLPMVFADSTALVLWDEENTTDENQQNMLVKWGMCKDRGGGTG